MNYPHSTINVGHTAHVFISVILQRQHRRARHGQRAGYHAQQHHVAPLAARAIRAPGSKQQGCGDTAEQNSELHHIHSPD